MKCSNVRYRNVLYVYMEPPTLQKETETVLVQRNDLNNCTVGVSKAKKIKGYDFQDVTTIHVHRNVKS